MKFEYFIALKGRYSGKSSVSSIPVRIAMLSVGLSVAVMILSIAVLKGFQSEIREKVAAFGDHLQISAYETTNSLEQQAIEVDSTWLIPLKQLKGVRYIHVYGIKTGIIRTDEEIHGAIFKGVDKEFDWSFFASRLDEGQLPEMSDTVKNDEVIISAKVSQLLNLKTGDFLRMYFISNEEALPRGRRFLISGVYRTGLDEFDDQYIFGHIRHIRKLNHWEDNQCSGLGIVLNDFNAMALMKDEIYSILPYDLNCRSLQDMYPQIFDWLELQDMNVWIIMILMTAVSAMALISILLILILEQTSRIGLYKALGARNWQVRKAFLLLAGRIALKGIFWGSLFSLLIYFIQDYFHVIGLPESAYYMTYVPVKLHWFEVVAVIMVTFSICLIALIIPSWLISRIHPVKAIRYE